MQPLRPQRGALQHAEAMLLVDHDQAERVEVDRPLHERVRADDQMDVAGRQPRQQHRAGAAPAVVPVSSSTRKRDFSSSLREAQEMLLRQNLGRRHERHLQAVLHRDERRQQRHDRLARADVALQQPVHRLRPLHVVDDLLQRAALPFGQPERQDLAAPTRGCDRPPEPATGFARPPAARRRIRTPS